MGQRNVRLLRCFTIALMFGLTCPSAFATKERFETLTFDTASSECRVQIAPYAQTISWSDGTALEVVAASGCASRLGRHYELQGDVRLTLLDAKRLPLLQVTANNADLDLANKRVVFPAEAKVNYRLKQMTLPGLLLNWNSRETKSFSGFYARF
ncbi:MAG TPA: hypothetical protein PLH57_07030 [Oligoflexia bacterium]|nr:hypothetical protein [Oligoflexia bacterium]